MEEQTEWKTSLVLRVDQNKRGSLKKFSSFLNWWSFFIWICKVCLCRSLLKQNLSLMSEQNNYMGTKSENYVSSKYFILLISSSNIHTALCTTQTWTPDSSNTPFIGFPTNGFILQLDYLPFLFHPSHFHSCFLNSLNSRFSLHRFHLHSDNIDTKRSANGASALFPMVSESFALKLNVSSLLLCFLIIKGTKWLFALFSPCTEIT